MCRQVVWWVWCVRACALTKYTDVFDSTKRWHMHRGKNKKKQINLHAQLLPISKWSVMNFPKRLELWFLHVVWVEYVKIRLVCTQEFKSAHMMPMRP